MSSDRKATEVLLSIEQKIDELVGFVRNIDHNNKLILSRLNMLESQPTAPRPNAQPLDSAGLLVPSAPQQQPVFAKPDKSFKFENRPKTNKFEQMQQSLGVNDDSLPLSKEERFELMEEGVPQGQRRGQRIEKTDSSRCNTKQIVQHMGQPLFMATVQIMNDSNQVIKRTRTNTVGRWTAPLDPGNYRIDVLKMPNEEKKTPLIESSYFVEIPPVKDIDLPIKEVSDVEEM